MQVIQVQQGQHQIVSAVLHVMEMDSTSEDLRARAMNERNPVHSMLFCQQGELLTANAAARRGIHSASSGGLGHLPLLHATQLMISCLSSNPSLQLCLAMGTAANPKVAADAIDARSHFHAMHLPRAIYAGLAVVCRHVPCTIQHHVPGFVF